MIKYRVSLTIEAETLFSLMSRILPIEDLHVEELVSQVPPSLIKRSSRKVPNRKRGPDLQSGINAIIMSIMTDGQPHHATEFEPLLSTSNYSPNSVASRLGALRKHGVITNIGKDQWKINSKTPTAI